MTGSSDFSEPFSITCPRCENRFRPSVRPTFYFAKCPECSEPIRVPAAAELEHPDSVPDRDLSAGEDTYRLARPPGWEDSPDEVHFAPYSVESPKSRKVRPEKKSRPAQEAKEPPAEESGPSPVPVARASCPACGASFELPPSEQPRTVLCPECLEDVHVPAGSSSPSPRETPRETQKTEADDSTGKPDAEASGGVPIAWETYHEPPKPPVDSWAVEKPKKKRRKKPPAEAAAELVENPTRREKSSKNVFDTMAEVRQVEEDPPPEWTFFSGMTDFLFRPEVAIRWLFASLGVCAIGWLCALLLHFYSSGTWLAMPFFVLPLIWIAIATTSYIAANSVVILLETAGGNDKVEGWPDPVLKEQAVDLVFLAFLLIVGEVVSLFTGNILSLFIGPDWLVPLVLLFLLYPILVLSALENDSPFLPLSWPILQSLKTVGWAWGVFYALSFGLMMVWVLPALWVFGESGWTVFLAMMVLAPLISGWCFLYARLMGRLAWRASLEFPDEEENATSSKEDHPKKNSPSESSGELQAAR